VPPGSSQPVRLRTRHTDSNTASRLVPDVLAAVDLGSNSFHMVVARYSHGQLVIIDRLREMVRLAAGVEENGRIDKEVAARALACLQRFGSVCATCRPIAFASWAQTPSAWRTQASVSANARAKPWAIRSKSSPAWRKRA